MRSRVTQPRSLFRIVASTNQATSTSSAAPSSSRSTNGNLVPADSRASSSTSAARSRLSSSARKNIASSPSATTTSHSIRTSTATSVSDRQFTSACAPPTSPPQHGRSRRTASSGTGRNLSRKRVAVRATSEAQALHSTLAKVAAIVPASPPPISASRLAWQRFFAQDRPLLEHHTVPRSRGHGQLVGAFSSFPGGLAEALTAATAESLVAAASDGAQKPFKGNATLMVPATASGMAFFGFLSERSKVSQWREPAKRVDAARFADLVDRLSGASAAGDLSAEAAANDEVAMFMKGGSSFQPADPLVRAESTRLREEQAFEEERAEAVRAALENGEDAVLAAALGKEADLTILGEPEGPSPLWSRGVATYLAERTRAYEAPEPPVALKDSKDATPHVTPKGSVYMSDDDPALMLSHAMVQASLPSALQWDRLTAQMDAAALGDPTQARQGVNVGILNADIHDGVHMDSVKRKRKTKMRKHKYRKLRKRQRSERQRLKK